MISIKDYPRSLLENLQFRAKLLQACENDKILAAEIKKLCSEDILLWVNLFCQTKDPRRKPDILPYITYPFQDKHIIEVKEAIEQGHDYLNDKSRDMGVSWDILYVFTWFWLFHKGSDFRVGSRKEDFVDKLNDIDTLLEKVRFTLKRMPKFLLPEGFKPDEHCAYMRIINPENGNSILGESANPHFGSGGRRKALLLDEFAKWDDSVAEAAWTSCYSKDTEVLTDKGWKLIKDVKIGESVYSLNPINHQASFMPVVKTYEQYREKMIEFSGRSIDLLVTENHKIVYETRKRVINFKSAKEVFKMKNGSIPLVSKHISQWNPNTIYGFDVGDWLEFLGWYISEGCTSKSGTIIISQSKKTNPDNVERIKNLLERMKLKYSNNGVKDFNVNVRGMNKKAREELRKLGKCYEKYIPERYFKLSSNRLRRLYESLILGDGCDRTRTNRNANATCYFTVSYKLAGNVQSLAQIIGYKASISTRSADNFKQVMGRDIKSFARDQYVVYIGYKTRANIDKLSRRYIDYNDNVYCVETKFHTLYVRRNGVACWCGNTADVTPCRIVVSTPLGSSNKFAQLAQGTKEKIKKLSLHWTLHPDKAKDAYYIDADKKIPVPLDKANELWNKRIKIRSPWYDAEAERRSQADLAQEVDIDYLKSGHPFFDLQALAKQRIWKYFKRANIYAEIPYGSFVKINLIEIDNRIEQREVETGWLRVYETPKYDNQYVVSADVSEGLSKGDEAFIVIRDKWTRNIVACANGLYPPEDLAVKVDIASRYYNQANAAVENNNHGFSVNSDLKQLPCKLYWTKRISPDGKETIVKAGWTTDMKSRPAMLDQLAEEIRLSIIELRDEVLIAQCNTFVHNERTGKPEADGDFLDDGVMACAIGSAVIKEIPYKPKATKQSKLPSAVREAQQPAFSY